MEKKKKNSTQTWQPRLDRVNQEGDKPLAEEKNLFLLRIKQSDLENLSVMNS